nr:serine/threonine-protein kinase [Nannocystis sp. RBIL2]
MASLRAELFGVSVEPERVDRFVVLEKLGVGGMGEVRAAFDPRLNRRIALKLVKHDVTAPARHGEARLLREAQVMARLSHPNVVQIHEVGLWEGRVFIAMELVVGCSLKAWLEAKPREWREIVRVFVEAGRGLAAAHAVGIVHRDFKPANVLLGDDDRVRVTDFGLARGTVDGEIASTEPDAKDPLVALAGASPTLAGTRAGTPGYMSPEQILGGTATAASDQFSFCVALYEAFYRERPFCGSQASMSPPAYLDAMLSAPLRAPPRSRVPQRIFRVLARGLRRDPAERYPNIQALLADLAPPTHRWSTWGLSLAMAGGLGLGFVFAGPGRNACLEHADDARLAWEQRAPAIEQVFLATGHPSAGARFAAVARLIERQTEAYGEARRQACDPEAMGNDPALRARSLVCLDQRRDTLTAAIQGLLEVDRSSLDGAVDRLASLPQIEDCSHHVLLAESCTALPTDPASEALQAALDEVRQTNVSGRLAETAAASVRIVAEAEAHGVAPLRAEARHLHATILAELVRPAEAQAEFIAAFEIAESAGCDGLAFDVATGMTKLVALNDQLDAQIGDDWSRYAFAKLGRIAGDNHRRAQALSDRGIYLQERRGQFAAAEQDYRESLALTAESGDGAGVRTLTLLNLGHALAEQGLLEESRATVLRTIDAFAELYGPDHPKLWKPHFNLGSVALELGDQATAEAAFVRSLELAQPYFGSGHSQIADIHLALATVAFDRQSWSAAVGHARTAASWCANADDGRCLDARRLLAQSLGELKRHPEALEILREVAASDALPPAERPAVAVELGWQLLHAGHTDELLASLDVDNARPEQDILTVQRDVQHGLALLKLGRPRDAIAPSERALTAMKPGDDARLRAEVDMTLARAYCRAGLRRDDVERLAASNIPDPRQLKRWIDDHCPDN